MRLFALLVCLVLVPGITLTLHFVVFWHHHASADATLDPLHGGGMNTLAAYEWDVDTLNGDTVPPSTPFRPRYHEIDPDYIVPDEGPSRAKSSFARATTIEGQAKQDWFAPRKLCKETCCVETVAISLEQDEHKIVNTKDGRDLADLTIQHRPALPHESRYFANSLQEDMLPCLLPGTVIQVDNHQKDLQYFWHVLRPKIKVPYVLITTGSDGDSPQGTQHDIGDPLLMKWYGTNPKGRNQDWKYQIHIHKFQPMALGLGQQQPQEKVLEPYLEHTRYANPFLDKDYWRYFEFNFDRDVFVHFEPARPKLWKALCKDANLTAQHQGTVSCNPQASHLGATPKLYQDMSRYRFGVSPPGFGYDTTRTYELLLLGIIPIVQKRDPWSQELFEGLPVVQIDDLGTTLSSREDLEDAVYDYLESPAFVNATFARGWNKLFTRHTRRQLLRDAERQGEILRDPKTGQEYYQGYRYSVVGSAQQEEDVYCETKGSCRVDAIEKINFKANHKRPKLEDSEAEWLETWRRM